MDKQEELIHYLQELFQERGCIEQKYIRSTNETKYKQILKYFGSLHNAVTKANIDYEVWKKVDKSDCTKELKRLYQEFGSVDSEIIKEHGNISIDSIKRKFGSLAAGLKACNIPAKPKQHRNVSKEDLEMELLRLHKEHGYLSKPLVEKYSKYGPKIVNRIYGSFANMYKSLGINRHPSGYIPSDQELLDEFRRLLKEHETISQDIIAGYGRFSTTCYKDRFGSINNVRKILGIKEVFAGESLHAEWIFRKIGRMINEEPRFETTFEWLKNPETGAHLRIDAYYPENNLAVEYNGPQHYVLDSRYTTTVEQLEYRKFLDKLKLKLLKEHGIRTLVIHYKDNVNDAYLTNALM